MYIVTNYRVDGQAVVALRQHPVPDTEFEAVVREYRKARRRKRGRR